MASVGAGSAITVRLPGYERGEGEHHSRFAGAGGKMNRPPVPPQFPVDIQLYQTVAVIGAQVESLFEDFEKDEGRRKAQYERIEKIERDLSRLLEGLDAMNKRVAKGEDAAATFERMKIMGRGYLIGASVAGAIGGGGIAIWLQDKIIPFIRAIGKG